MTTDREHVLDIRGLTKRFIGTLALDHVDFSLRRGEIHALVGENGAGKSTLIKVLAGLFPLDAGEIRFEGAVVHPHAQRLPIYFVHQDLGLVDELSIGENIALVAGFPRRAGMIDWGQVWSRAREVYRMMDLDPPDPRAKVGTLDAAGKAMLGIVRALAHKASVLVLDEPTASLPEPDAQQLFGALRKLRDVGTAVIYVSHRLSELFALVDRITVLRDGRNVRTAPVADMTPETLVADMLGRSVEFGHSLGARQRGTPVVEVEELCAEEQGPLSFEVDSGEIVGLVGLRGAGQETIGRAIFGAVPTRSGHIRLGGTNLPSADGVAERIAAGIILLAGDRGRESAFSGMSVRENLFPYPGITHASAWTPLSPSEERRRTRALLERFNVRPAYGEALVDWLSGGNQQKVFVARWLAGKARLLILEEPTAGVDIGAKLAIHRMIRDTADAGAAALVVSSDFEEVAALCDRALMVSRGRIIGELRGAALTVDNLLAGSSAPASPVAAARHGTETGVAGDAVKPEAEIQRRAAPAGSTQRLFDFVSSYGLVVVFALVMLVFGALRPESFLRASNINNVLVGQSVTAMLALAEMVPLATRQFDLSVGFLLGMSQVLIIALQVTNGVPWLVAIAIVLGISVLVGLLNAVLITVFRIDSFIATMGTGTLLFGVSNWYTGGQQVVGMDLAASFGNLTQIVGHVPLPAVYVAVVAIILWVVTERLPVGRSLYVIGANPQAAELIGIRVGRHVGGAFVVSGLLSGVAGIMLGSILQAGTPSVGPEYLLPAFAAALLGATSIRPGRVNVVGTILAVLILAFSFSGVQQLGAPFYVQYFFNGGILIIAVGLSVYAAARRRRAAGSGKGAS